MKQLTKLEIIEETVKYYSEDVNRRAMNKEGGCMYKNNEGEMCAVGRCLIDAEEFARFEGWVDALDIEFNLESILKDQYTGHTIDFWKDLQDLHDNPMNWNPDALTKEGRDFVNHLEEKWKD